MYRILYVTPFAPSYGSGGGRHCLMNLGALCKLQGVEIDYVGPSFDPGELGTDSGCLRHTLARDFTLVDRLRAGLGGALSSVYALMDEFHAVRPHRGAYDLTFVESTRCSFVLSHPASQSNRVVCCIHNVESDYLSGAGVVGRLFGRRVRRRECESLSGSDLLLPLHQADINRIGEEYPELNLPAVVLHPPCSAHPDWAPLEIEARPRWVGYVGTLSNRSNERAVSRFLEDVWSRIDSRGFKLVIAGRDPPRWLAKRVTAEESIVLSPNPRDIQELIRQFRLLVLPDLAGFGMKLRVAEAMSLGVPVLGTRLALRGYEGVDRFGVLTDSVDAMAGPLEDLISDQAAPALRAMAERAQREWRVTYSQAVFERRLVRTILSLLGESSLPPPEFENELPGPPL